MKLIKKIMLDKQYNWVEHNKKVIHSKLFQKHLELLVHTQDEGVLMIDTNQN